MKETACTVKQSTLDDLICTVEDYENRLEQILYLAKALYSMAGQDDPKAWIVLAEMICDKAEV